MQNRRIKQWITINGNHIPIFEGESESDASDRYTMVTDAESGKSRQITGNKSEADARNSKSNLPRRLYLPDIPAETANQTTDILNLETKERYRFKSGTKITRAYVFAGNGCSKEFRNAEKYAKRYGGKVEDWQHCAGIAQITDGFTTATREVHWVQGKSGRMREAFIKFR